MAKIIGNTTATPNPRPDWSQMDESKADYIKNKPNIESGEADGSLQQSDIKQENYTTPGGIASGVGAVALTGQRGDKDPATLDPNEDRISEASGLQAFVAGPGNLAAGDWDFVTGKDNTVYSNRAFVSGGANVSQAVDSEGNLLEEKTNVGRFNAIFGNNNEFYSSNESSQSNLIAGGSNIVDSGASIVERNIIGGYNNKLIKDDTARTDAKQFNIIGGQQNELKGSAGNDIVGGYNNSIQGTNTSIISGDNSVITYLSNSLVIGKGLSAEKPYVEGTPDPIIVLGKYNDINIEDKVFVIGGGNSDSDRKNVFEVYNDGVVETEQGTLSTQEWVNDRFTNYKPLKLNIGTNNTDADADNSLTVGQHSLNRGAKSAAIGWDAYVGYDSSGNATSKKPTGAVALNWSRANADYCLSAGYDTEVNHSWSVSLNNKTKTGASAQTVIGSYNAAKSTTAFEVGNGDSDTPKNAFEVLKAGGFNSYGDSTITGNLVVEGRTDATLGAIVSKKGNTTYGLTYDGDAFKLGEGSLDENNDFTFGDGEGLPVALRDDSIKFTDGHLVSWSADGNKLVDSGKSINDIGSSIIDVEVLPTENINRNALYRVREKISILNGAKNIYLGLPVIIKSVETLPTIGEYVTDNDSVSDSTRIMLYYQASDREAYAYTQMESGDMWLTVSELLSITELPYGGIVSSKEEATETDTLYITNGDYVIYSYTDKWNSLNETKNGVETTYFSGFEELFIWLKANYQTKNILKIGCGHFDTSRFAIHMLLQNPTFYDRYVGGLNDYNELKGAKFTIFDSGWDVDENQHLYREICELTLRETQTGNFVRLFTGLCYQSDGSIITIKEDSDVAGDHYSAEETCFVTYTNNDEYVQGSL